MESKDLVRVLNEAKLTIFNEESFCNLIEGTTDIERNIHFDIGGNEYAIGWYKNLMTLKQYGNKAMEIKFTNIKHSGTWSNHYKRNLQMYYGNDCVCIIGLEKYDG